jgi:capsid portal protein
MTTNNTGAVTEDVIIEKAFILGNGEIVTPDEVVDTASAFYKRNRKDLDEATREMKKAMPGSAQADSKDSTDGISENDIVNPPYDPSMLAQFLEAEAVHFRSVRVKVTDSVMRDWMVIPKEGVDPDDPDFLAEKEMIETFAESANENMGFEGVLEASAMDYEGVGFTPVEVVRSLDKKIRYLYHIPAPRVRVLKGFNGFVERTSNSTLRSAGNSTYYLPFGRKLLSPKRKDIKGNLEPYDPAQDGDIKNAVWNLRSKKDLNKTLPFGNIADSANEILFIPKIHPKSIYYGVPDVIPAIGAILGNINIRDFFLQFFDNNTVPQYAIIVKGAKLSEEVKREIQKYFSQEIKGSAHKTLVIPIPAAGGDVEITFERLSADTKEGSFQETRKNNWAEILISHGLAPAIVGIIENAQLGSGRGQAQQENHKNRVVAPIQKLWQRRLTQLFRLGLGAMKSQIKFDSLDAADLTQERENLVNYQRNGNLSINQVRERAKLGPPIDGGERNFIVIGNLIVFVDELPKLNSDSETSRENEEEDEEALKVHVIQGHDPSSVGIPAEALMIDGNRV